MTAQDNLSPKQFPSMPMDQILKLPTIDRRYGSTVEETLPHKQADMQRHPIEYGALRANMRNRGQTAPIGIMDLGGQPTVYQGHHRIAIAKQQGWKSMTYTDQATDTDDHEWDKAANKKYGEFFG
jgi:hypothetical protein